MVSNKLSLTFREDLEILNNHHQQILLKGSDGKSIVAISPEWQGRVMTSSLHGMEGSGLGWINHKLIRSREIKPHINAFGGEDRFWLGPEGGQFSFYFKPDSEFNLESWQVPAEIDTEPFDIVKTSDKYVSFKKQMNLLNYSGHTFNFLVERDINLLDASHVNNILGININNLEFVAYESVNRIKNTGTHAWNEETGTLSIWILGMFQPSEATTIVIPFKTGDESNLGPKVNDSYFGKIPSDRLIVREEVLFFSGDGKHRGKLGIGPKRALPYMGAYNARTNVLTIVNFTLAENVNSYVNSMWEIQDEPYSGDVLNSYNDGPVGNGSQLGPFFELESSSPAAFLGKGEQMVHKHRTIHLSGETKKLDEICNKIFGRSLDEIKSVFK